MNRWVRAACLLSLAIGLLFLFVRAPHPWGWNGFDHYHELALALASGQPFPTMEVPWGYAYFLSFFYRLFGDHPWIPLLVQVSLNALTPLLLFALARRWTDARTATVAAVLLGALSFNTVYASTQSSDAICTVLFLTAVLVFVRAMDNERRAGFALAGVLAGVMSQFRPNLILIPGVLAAFALWKVRSKTRLVDALLLLVCAGATLTPWIVRNYRLTRTIVPTSVHGGAQLWYGSLQVGPYLDSRAYNPKSIFETPAFKYTSLRGVPILIDGGVNTCVFQRRGSLSLVYWTDFDPVQRRMDPVRLNENTGRFRFELPAPPDDEDAAYYYFFETTWPSKEGATTVDTPAGGRYEPSVYFVSQDHLGDMDRHHELLDVFDVVRLARHEAWGDPIPPELTRAGITSVHGAVIVLLLRTGAINVEQDVPVRVDRDEASATVRFGDNSSIVIPRDWHERITDLTITGPIAESVMHSQWPLVPLTMQSRLQPRVPDEDARCAIVGEVKINDVFYREQPEAQRRYSALALDNIRRAPLSFLKATLFRVYRVFVVVGSSDRWTNQQFAGAAAVYGAATIASLTFLGLFIAGIVILWKRGADILLPLLLILYVPATIAPLLTNMRYSVTVQPLMFVFASAAILAVFDRVSTRTARRP